MKFKRADKGITTGWQSRFIFRQLLAGLLIFGLVSGAQAAPEGGVVRAGNAQIIDQGSKTLIQQSSQRAVIDWRGFGINANEQVQFAQPSASSATLNRVTGSQVSMILGRLDANGQVLLINPNGIIFGKGAQVNVGSLIASTANLSNENFMQGKLIFDQAGKPGAGIVNSGSITAAEGGLIALVAPHVRNDGLIQARLGKVTLGAADTFTIDLYGDGLINLALSDASLAQLKDAQGQPIHNLITQAGTIDVGSGKAILVTAEAAKGMLDGLINMSGTILADSAVQEGGRILLLAKGGNVDVSGHLSARGTAGGQIEVLGDQVHLASTAKLDADGTYGGGKLHVGGAFQGSGDTYRAKSTQIDAGATLQANALARGDGGEVVVWSDGRTAYAGSIQARGGAETGDGGRVEVSGKQTLAFNGLVDAGAPNGKAGSLLLDPFDFTIGEAEANLISIILRRGTSTAVNADNDIFVNHIIYGLGRYTGGGLTLSAGNNININDYILTNNGAINLYAAAGTVNLAPGKVVYAGMAPITVRSGTDLYNAPYLTGGLLSLISTRKSVFINQGIDASIGNLFIQAAEDVNINQPIVSHSDGNSVTITAGKDINVNNQINGSGGSAGGTIALAASGNVNLNEHLVTNNGAITITAGGTLIQKADGLDTFGAPLTKQVRSGTAPIAVTTGGDLSFGSLVTTGSLNVTSTGGKISIDVPVYETTGNTSITAAKDIDILQLAANPTAGSSLTMTSTGGNINVNAKVGPWDRATGVLALHNALPGGPINLQAHGNVNIYTDIASYKGALAGAEDASIRLTAETGTVDFKINGVKVMSDRGAIYVSAYGDLNNGPYINKVGGVSQPASVVNALPTTGYFTAGPLSMTSVAGKLSINQIIPDTTGEVTLRGGNSILVNQRIYTNNANISLFAGASGITMAPDTDPESPGTGVLSDIDSRLGNLTLEAKGDILPSLLRTAGTLTVKSTEGFLTGGMVYRSRVGSGMFPGLIELAGSKGITDFDTGFTGTVKAISDGGSVEGLKVSSPSSLEVVAFGNIKMSGLLGMSPRLYAGGDIMKEGVVFGLIRAGHLVERAGHNIESGSSTIGVMAEQPGVTSSSFSYIVKSLNQSAGTNPFTSFADDYRIAGVAVKPLKDSWTAALGPGNISAMGCTWVAGEGGLTANATGNISIKDVHVSYDLMLASSTIDPRQTRQPLTMLAGGSITIDRIENMGPIVLSTLNGSVNLSKTIGEHVAVKAPAAHLWNPYDLAPASIEITARNGHINMVDARAAGNITMSAYGNWPASGYINYSNAFESGGSVTLKEFNTTTGASYTYVPDLPDLPDLPGDYSTKIPTATVYRLPVPTDVSPIAPPGPSIAGPGAPVVPGALPPGAPGIPGVTGYALPSEPNTTGSEQEVQANRLTANVQLSEIIPVEDEEEGEEENRKKILKISYGHSATQVAELGLR